MAEQTRKYAIGSPEYIFDAVRTMVDENLDVLDNDITELRKSSRTCDIIKGGEQYGFVSDMVLANGIIEDMKRHIFNTVGIVPISETENLLRMINSRKQELADITEVFESTCKCTK